MADAPTIKSMMEENRVFDPPAKLKENAWIKNFDEYKTMYDRSIDDPDTFWAEMAENFTWTKKWDKVRSYDFRDKIDIKFYEGAETNITVNCLDRHVEAGKGDRTAIIWKATIRAKSKNTPTRNCSARFASAPTS